MSDGERTCPRCRGNQTVENGNGDEIDCARCDGRGTLPECPREDCDQALETGYGLRDPKQWLCSNCKTYINPEELE